MRTLINRDNAGSKAAAVYTETQQERINELYSGLLRYCRFLSKNDWDADDLAQDSIIKAAQRYPNGDISSALLNKIAYHQWIDMLRKSKHETIGIPDGEETASFPPDTAGLIDSVNLLLERLTPKQAVIFAMKEAFGYRSREIAGLLQMSETAVKSLLHRAKSRLEKEEAVRSAGPFLDRYETNTLTDLFFHSLKNGDPAILVEGIEIMPSLIEAARPAEPSLALLPGKKPSKASHSFAPLCSFNMAA